MSDLTVVGGTPRTCLICNYMFSESSYCKCGRRCDQKGWDELAERVVATLQESTQLRSEAEALRDKVERLEQRVRDLQKAKHPKCADCKGSGVHSRGGDRFVYCESCNGKGF